MTTQRILFADAAGARVETSILCVPAPVHAVRLAGRGSARTMEAAVLKPIDLQRTHGVRVRLEDLVEMQRAYDRNFEEAALNFDHAWGGPAHGWCARCWLGEGDLFWTLWDQVSPEAVDAVESGRFKRLSSEFTTSHPQTGGWYFFGTALLGATKPAVPGLPGPKLLSRPIARVFLTAPDADTPETPGQADPPAPSPAPDGAEQEPDMTTPAKKDDKTVPAGPGGAPPPAAPAPTTPETPEAAPAGGTSATEVELALVTETRKALEHELAQARQVRLAALRERAEARVDKALSALGARVSPGMLRAGLKGLLVELAAAETPATVKLAAADGKTVESSVFDTFVKVLEAAPEFAPMGGARRELATADGETPADTRDAATRELDARHGITPERRAQLEQKYPGSFGEPN
jgi:hypothetical protein